jgi:hypothetical protein
MARRQPVTPAWARRAYACWAYVDRSSGGVADEEPAALACAFLPAGGAALTRRAKRASRLSAVVVRFSRRAAASGGSLSIEPSCRQASRSR